ncbi:hypothetical protein L3X38_025712 [Prunus dulcis]|uniref:Uncharacterized protein n=1 Tax=Prunus dulcis TaxID=3755 RepID=A0AAD4W286_PRUDU|nr:hypothetical protein L3X38_025712 [Prunus dulcis]
MFRSLGVSSQSLGSACLFLDWEVRTALAIQQEWLRQKINGLLVRTGCGALGSLAGEEACESWVSWQGVIIVRGPCGSRSSVVRQGVHQRGLEAVLRFQQIVIR